MTDKHDIARLVQRRIEPLRIEGDIILTILEDGINQDNDGWYVPIQPTSEPRKTSPYYEALAEIEGQLLDEDGINILFIPTAAKDQQVA
jgi:hypothetical protein